MSPLSLGHPRDIPWIHFYHCLRPLQYHQLDPRVRLGHLKLPGFCTWRWSRVWQPGALRPTLPSLTPEARPVLGSNTFALLLGFSVIPEQHFCQEIYRLKIYIWQALTIYFTDHETDLFKELHCVGGEGGGSTVKAPCASKEKMLWLSDYDSGLNEGIWTDD